MSLSWRRRLVQRLEVPHQEEGQANRWNNYDLKPVGVGRRVWGARQFVDLWVLINMNIAGYQMGSSLVADGLNWWQAVICIAFGNILAAVFCTLNSTSGAYYHIGYPAIARIAFGMNGSYFAILNRILLSVVWFAVQAWSGGLCVLVCLRAIFPGHIDTIPNPFPVRLGMDGAQFMCYILFMLICVPLTYVQPHKLNLFLKISSGVVVINQLAMLIWALATMKGGLSGSVLNSGVVLDRSGLAWAICSGTMAQIGGIAAGILNDNDFTRLAKAPERRAIVAQAISFPVTAFLTALFGILITAATAERYGEALWNPPDLLLAAQKAGGPGSRASTFLCGAAWTISQLGVNIPGNLIAGGVDVAALWPKYINLRRGAYLVLGISVVANPWRLLSSSSVFLEVLSAYSVFLSPMTGLLVSQYYVIQKRYYNVPDLYIGDKRSIYWYTHGVNWRAFVAFFSGVVPCITGFIGSVSGRQVSAAAIHIYDLNYVVGFGISFVANWLLHHLFPVSAQRKFVKRMEEAGTPRHIDGMMEFLEAVAGDLSDDYDGVDIIHDTADKESGSREETKEL